MTPFFPDTGYVIALEASDDQNHTIARLHWQRLKQELPPLVTTTYVLDEIVTFFNSRNRHAKAVEIGNRLRQSPSIRLIHVDTDLFEESWQYFTRHADKRYSFTDCISFVIMRRQDFQTALTFDHHFSRAEFVKVP